MAKSSASKIILTIALVTVYILVLATVLFACDAFNDKSYIDEDYIEVQELRMSSGSAEIKMSSSGDPSKYQLSIKTYPENATNKQLTYYISSEYHQYVTVTKDGLLEAHKVSDGLVVPVTVRSTTNQNAKIEISVTVEDVAVEKVKFTQESLSLLYNGDKGYLQVTYVPSHAVDGRNATFVSLNESICMVNNSGEVTPVGVGNTTVKAICSTRTGKLIEEFIAVTVSYASGQYQLDVAGSPDFNQVIGDYSPIEFTLLILGENVDPNPEIKWYVDTERVASSEDRTQYTHVPSATTQITYYIYVYVTPYQGTTVKLQSKPITVYQAFNGIDLAYDNLSSVYTGYRYGDEVTFDLSAGDASATVVSYEWVLAESVDPQNTVVVATTLPADRNLTRRINVSGDYALTARGLDANGNLVKQTMFTFSAEKLLEGDTLVVRPQLLNYGLPPDSYHYYVVPCDENGNYDVSEKTLYADMASSETLYYPLQAGNFRFIITASIGGVSATVSKNGEKVPFEYVSDVIRVYGTDYRDTARDNDLIDINNADQKRFAVEYYPGVERISIEGIGRDTTQVFLKWNNTTGTSFVVEITLGDGSVIIVDSSENTSSRFGSNYCYLSTDVVTLEDTFSVRVKKKSGFYSQVYYYGTANSVGAGDETHILSYDKKVYPFFSTIGYNNATSEYSPSYASAMDAPALNAYLYDMEDLREYLEFILLFRPSENTYITMQSKTIGELLYDNYSAEVFIPFVISEEEKVIYPSGLTEEQIASYGIYSNIAEAVYGAAASLNYATEFLLEISAGENGIVLGINILVGNNGTLKDTGAEKGKSTIGQTYSMDGTNEFFAVDLKDKVNVQTSEELVFALEQGYNPSPNNNDELSTLLTIIKNLVKAINPIYQGDVGRILAFYEYLAQNVTLDGKIADITANTTSEKELYLYKPYRLEGAFTGSRTVTSEGMAKAFSAMCNVAGIPCLSIVCGVEGGTRAFNKVFIDGTWYVVDVTMGMRVIDGYSVVSREGFLISDATIKEHYDTEDVKATDYGSAPVCVNDYGTLYHYVADVSGVKNLLTSLINLGEVGYYGLEIEFDKSVYGDEDGIVNELKSIDMRGISVSTNIAVMSNDNKKIRVLVLAMVTGE